MSRANELRALPSQTVISTVAGVPGTATPAPTPPIPHLPAIVPATVAKPDALFRHLVQLETFLATMWRSLGSNVFAGGVNIRGIQMGAGVGLVLNHKLGRAYVGWTVTRCQAPSGVYPTVIETTLPTGYDPMHSLQLEASKACVLDVLIF